MTNPYSMLIQWSEPDRLFLVLFPELTGDTPQTHGSTYEEAARQGQVVLELLIESFEGAGSPLPSPIFCRFSEGFEDDVRAVAGPVPHAAAR